MKKVFCSVFLLLALGISLTGCIPAVDDFSVYRGTEPAFYTATIHSVPGMYRGDNQDFLLLEEDSYGKILYACLTHLSSCQDPYNKALILLILQSKNDSTVSYIEDVNYLVIELTPDAVLTKELVENTVSAEEIDELKVQNAWDAAWLGSLVQKSIDRDIEDPFDQKVRKDAFSKISSNYSASDDLLLTTDKNGNAIYFLREFNQSGDCSFEKGYFLFMQADGTVAAIEAVANLCDYRDQLIAFKQANGWAN